MPARRNRGLLQEIVRIRDSALLCFKRFSLCFLDFRHYAYSRLEGKHPALMNARIARKITRNRSLAHILNQQISQSRRI